MSVTQSAFDLSILLYIRSVDELNDIKDRPSLQIRFGVLFLCHRQKTAQTAAGQQD